jgi:hypothetical protein
MSVQRVKIMCLPNPCTSRVEWAEKKLDTLKVEIDNFIKGHSHQRFTDEDPDTGEKIIRFTFPEPPNEFSLEISEILHHLRSTLDALVFNLAGCPDDRKSNLMFPIFPTERSYMDHEKVYLEGVGGGAQALIRGLQPYNVPGGWDYPWPYDPEEQPLMFLHDFNRVDKHRTLRVVKPSVERVQIAASQPFIKRPNMGIQEDATGLLRVPKDMEVDVRPSFTITFENGWPTRGAEVVTCLGALLREVRSRILPKFIDFFDESGVRIPNA